MQNCLRQLARSTSNRSSHCALHSRSFGSDSSLRRTKTPSESNTHLAEILGEINPHETRRRAPAGPIMKLIDLSSAQTAHAHIQDGEQHGPAGASLVTLSFDKVNMMISVLHGEVLRLDSRIVSVGNSSMLVEVTGKKHDATSRSYTPVLRCLTTFVALGDDGRPAQVPALVAGPHEHCASERDQLETWVNARKELTRRWQDEMKAVEVLAKKGELVLDFDSSCLTRDSNLRFQRVRLRDTVLELRKMFLPKHTNPG